MKPTWRSLKYCLALLLLSAMVPRTRAQYAGWLDSQQPVSPWDPVPRLEYLRMDIEAEQDSFRSAGAPTQDTTRLYLSPRVGIGWNNYVYSPYLLSYSLLFEPGYEWQNTTWNGKPQDLDQLTLDGTFQANLLQLKPYSTTLSYSRQHEETKYGFFDTAIVDSDAFGATTGYRDGPVPVNVSFQKSYDDATALNQETLTDQTQLNLHAHNDRANDDATQLDYEFSQFDRTTKGFGYNFTTDNTYNYASLLDMEHFGRSDLKSSFQLNNSEAGNSSTTELNVSENYTVNHTPNLHSYYDYTLTCFTGDASDEIQNYAVAGVQHQLFESLSSSAEINGTQLNSSSAGTTFDSQSVGTTVSADYTKRLGSWGHLDLNNSSSYNITAQQTSGGAQQINDESHTVPTNAIVRLDQPRDTSIISITDGNFNPLQPADYTLIQSTDPWQIKINIVGPSHIQAGSTILVTYTVQANPSGNFSIYGNQSQIRVTFWHNRIGVYALYDLSDSHASSQDLLLENDRMFQLGADFTWGGLGLTANYIDDHSTLYYNRSYNLAETYSMSVSPQSSLGVILNQQWNINSSPAIDGTPALPEQHSSFYNFMLNCNWRPLQCLNWSGEIGYQHQDGFGLDENLLAARTYLNWHLGKLQINLGYQHENQDLPNEKYGQDFFFLRAKRSF